LKNQGKSEIKVKVMNKVTEGSDKLKQIPTSERRSERRPKYTNKKRTAKKERKQLKVTNRQKKEAGREKEFR
jgi:hypothetical protein